MTTRLFPAVGLAGLVLVSACGGSNNSAIDAHAVDAAVHEDAARPDAAVHEDAAQPDAAVHDDAAPADATRPDAPRAADANIPDAAPPPDSNVALPATLGGTGLCVDEACTTISSDVVAYQVQWPLWADGATKLRWIYIPPGAQIDTSDMDYWRYPTGTKVWKEFDVGGVRLETRYLEKIGAADSAWNMVSYAWRADQSEADLATAGVMNAQGTGHVIPSHAVCTGCHNKLPGRVLGFTALQLDAPSTDGSLTLDGAIANNWLSVNPPGTSSPHFPLPGASADQAALGYLHSNCGHCHNPMSPISYVGVNLRMEVSGLATVSATEAYITNVNVVGEAIPVFDNGVANGNNATIRIVPGDALDSILFQRFVSPNAGQHMPTTGENGTDPTGEDILTTWINAL